MSLSQNNQGPGHHDHRGHRCHDDHGHHFVTVKIGEVEKKIHIGTYSVAEIKKLGEVPLDSILEVSKEGQLIPLPDDGNYEICRDTVFFVCPRVGASS